VPPVETERRDEPPKSVAMPRASSRGDSLAFEESLLERARKASDSSPASALALLREHERRFPAGELTAERLFLMAKASAKAGNEKAARRYGRELERRFPKSAYLPELRAQLPGSF
jgi:Tfp pilus assembly protein PilF